MSYTHQQKAQDADAMAKPAPSTHKASSQATAPTRLPAWTQAWGNKPPPGLRLPLPPSVASTMPQTVEKPLSANSISSPAVIQRKGGYIPNHNVPYQDLGNNICSMGGRFTGAVQNAIYEDNEDKVMVAGTTPTNYISDSSNTLLTDDNTIVATIDHVYPAERGGLNSYHNAQVLSITENGQKDDDYPWGTYNNVAILVTGDSATNANFKRGDFFPVTGWGNNARVDTSKKMGPNNMTILQAHNNDILDENKAPTRT